MEIEKQEYCDDCPIYKTLSYRDVVLYEDFLADIIAYYIAGKNSLYEFIDAFFQRVSKPKLSLGFLLRVVSTFTYLELIDGDVNDLKINIEKLINAYETSLLNSEEDYKCPLFLECITNICAIWADTINVFDKNVMDYISEKLGDGTIAQHLEVNKSFFKTIINDEFRIEEEENNKIIAALKEGRPIPEKDPRHILHCYYEVYKQSDGEKRPNYAATIYSLAFNTYSRNRRD